MALLIEMDIPESLAKQAFRATNGELAWTRLANLFDNRTMSLRDSFLTDLWQFLRGDRAVSQRRAGIASR